MLGVAGREMNSLDEHYTIVLKLTIVDGYEWLMSHGKGGFIQTTPSLLSRLWL